MRIMQITNARSIGILDSSHDDDTKQMMLVLQNLIGEETVSLNPAFDYTGLAEEVAAALLDLTAAGETHREHLTRYARSRANRFVYLRQSGWR
jgi:hypothetical protein